MQTYSNVVERIKHSLESSTKPMTTGDLSNDIGITTQTVRRHISTAIHLGYARQSPFTRNGAPLYEATNKKTSILPAVPLPNGDVMPIRDIFIKWSHNPPQDEFSKDVALIVARLYELVYAFTESDSNLNPQAKIQLIKETRSRIFKQRERLKNALDILNSLYNNEKLWDPKDLVKALLIIDDEINDEIIASAIDRYKGAYE